MKYSIFTTKQLNSMYETYRQAVKISKERINMLENELNEIERVLRTR